MNRTGSTLAAPAPANALPLQSQPAPDDVALHFGGAGVDRASKRVAHDTLDFRLHHVTVAAHQLDGVARSEEHTSELQSLMRRSYAVFCLKKKKNKTTVQQN